MCLLNTHVKERTSNIHSKLAEIGRKEPDAGCETTEYTNCMNISNIVTQGKFSHRKNKSLAINQ